MSAITGRNPWGAWVGHCAGCRETLAGSRNMVELWADVHNDDNHRNIETDEETENQ